MATRYFRRFLARFSCMLAAAALGSSVAAATPAAAGQGMLADRVRQICEDEPSRVTSSFCRMRVQTVELIGPDDRRIRIEALVAADESSRTAGYQFVAGEVVEQTAILFLFDRAASGPFHMCNVEVPLDIVWFREDGTILDSLTMMPGGVRNPIGCRQLYRPRRFGTYRFALELPEGSLEELGIASGDGWRLDVRSWVTE